MQAEELVISFFERVYNQKDFAYVFEIYADTYYEHTEKGARCNQDCYNIITGVHSIFPDLHVTMNEILSRDDVVAVRLTITATHQGEFFGIPATGKAITFEAMEFFKIANGKITESWGSWPIYDILEILKQ